MRVEQHLDTCIIRLHGEFDLSCDEHFQVELGRAIDEQTETLVLDLRGLEFIDSTGLRMLVQLDRLAERQGIDFTVLCADGQVKFVLKETGLDRILPIVDPAGVVPRSEPAI
jgi:stage II sporulation protein AA (anti-sigma F factor antagonist)